MVVHTHKVDKIVLRFLVQRFLKGLAPPFNHQFAKWLTSSFLNVNVEVAVNDERKLACMALAFRKHIYAAYLILFTKRYTAFSFT